MGEGSLEECEDKLPGKKIHFNTDTNHTMKKQIILLCHCFTKLADVFGYAPGLCS
jgi:hypothetical protein